MSIDGITRKVEPVHYIPKDKKDTPKEIPTARPTKEGNYEVPDFNGSGETGKYINTTA